MNESDIKEYEEYELTDLIELVDEEALLDINFHKYLLNRIFRENSQNSLNFIFKKNSSFFSYLNDEKREEILNLYVNIFYKVPIIALLKICKDTLMGNLIFIMILFKNENVIDNKNLYIYNLVKELNFIDNDNLLEYIPQKNKIVLRIEDLSTEKIEVDLITDFFENLFFMDLILLNKSFISSMINLYNKCLDKKYIIKKNILHSILNNDFNQFYNLIKTNSQFEINNDSDFITYYKNIYLFLTSKKIPIYFYSENIISDDKIINNNAYFLIIENKINLKRVIGSFEKIEINDVSKYYDFETDKFLKPISFYKPITIISIYSFAKILLIKETTIEQRKKTMDLSEDEIENRLEIILKDYSKTGHGPTEKLDIWSHRIAVFNEDDIKMGGFLIKGKSFKKVYLKNIAENLIKAVSTNIEILFFVYTGTIDDGARDNFIKQCEINKKFYSFINLEDLTRIFLAYDVL